MPASRQNILFSSLPARFYINPVMNPDPRNFLTKEQQKVLCVILLLLLVGLAVKTYRTRHPRTAAASLAPAAPDH